MPPSQMIAAWEMTLFWLQIPWRYLIITILWRFCLLFSPLKISYYVLWHETAQIWKFWDIKHLMSQRLDQKRIRLKYFELKSFQIQIMFFSPDFIILLTENIEVKTNFAKRSQSFWFFNFLQRNPFIFCVENPNPYTKANLWFVK